MNEKELHSFLEEKFKEYNCSSFIESDPISIPHRFSKKEDIETSAFLAASIAWGQRITIIRNANELMRRMDFAPHDFILNHTKKDLTRFKNFKHRTFNGTDCIFFLQSLQNIYRKHNSLENVFNRRTAREAIINFRKTFFSIPHSQRTEKHISNPDAGSSAKRLNMFLRWMIRNDKRGVDFGIWNSPFEGGKGDIGLSPKDLMCPLDIHSGNTARKLGLLARKQNDWQSVEELTSRLREFDSKDPAKYDFALFGLGVFEKF